MTSERLQIVYELCVVLENTDAQLRGPPVILVVLLPGLAQHSVLHRNLQNPLKSNNESKLELI